MAAFAVRVARRGRLTAIDRYERRLRARGFTLLAGVDEAGRGALAGPLVAAAVILPEEFDLDGVDDSKVLTPRQREEQYARITQAALAISVCRGMAGRIDRHGLHRTNLALLRRAIRSLDPRPEFVLTDGFPLSHVPVPCLAMKGGDGLNGSVAAASIVAKVTRDRAMRRYHRRWPEYGFDTNKGYGTRRHWEALERLGPTPIHRYSFKGVGQTSLFTRT